MSTTGSQIPPVGPWGGGTQPGLQDGVGSQPAYGNGAVGATPPVVAQSSVPFQPFSQTGSPATPSAFPSTPSATFPPGPGAGAFSGIGDMAVAPTSSLQGTKAPVGLLYGSLAASVVALALAGLFEHVGIAVLAWVLAVLVGLGLTALFLVRDARRKTRALYVSQTWHQWLYRGAVVAALLAVVAAAGRIALYVGRM